jgi:hypothetical protein
MKNFTAHKSNKFSVHQGQALLFVVVATTIALVIGVNVANRSISSARRTTSTDTFTRVLNAAEGAIELAVGASTEQLSKLASDDFNSADCEEVFGGKSEAIKESGVSKCQFPYETRDNEGQGNKADSLTEAIVSVSSDNEYSDNNPLVTTLDNPGTVFEVNLENYEGDSVRICWGQQGADATLSAKGTALYYILYSKPPSTNENSIVVRQGLQVSDFDAGSGSPLEEAAFAYADKDPNPVVKNPANNMEYDACASIEVGNGKPFKNEDHSVYGLRIKSTHRPTDLAVVPQEGHTLPSQGFRIVAVGRLINNGIGQGQEKISKTITATKTFAFLPAIFDYAIYMHEGSLSKGGN